MPQTSHLWLCLFCQVHKSYLSPKCGSFTLSRLWSYLLQSFIFLVYSLLCFIFARKNLGGERKLGVWKLEILLLSHLGNSRFYIFININVNFEIYIKILNSIIFIDSQANQVLGFL